MFKRVKSVIVENGLVSKSSLVLTSYLKMRLILKMSLYIFPRKRVSDGRNYEIVS